MLDLQTVAVGGGAFLITYVYMKSRRPSKAPPGPYVWPFAGNLLNVTQTTKFHLVANDYYKKYGPICSLQMAFYPAIMLSDLKVIKEAVIDKADIFSDRPLWLPFLQTFTKDSHGVAFVNGDEFKAFKKLVLSSMRELGFGAATIEDKIHEEVRALTSELESVKGQGYNFRFLFNKATANVICAVLFAKRYDYDDHDFNNFIEKLNLIMSRGGFQNKFMFLPLFFTYCMPLLNPSVLLALRHFKEFSKFLQKQINEHRSSLQENNPRDLIDICIEAGVRDVDTAQVLSDLFLAGSETTSTTISWSILFMMKHEDVQEKCRHEITQVCGSDRLPKWSEREDLPYCMATLFEIQRLANVGPLTLTHNNNAATKLGGYDIPKDTIVFINLYSVHMSPEHWDEPEVFRPERFLSEDKTKTIKPEAFIPFGLGRRSCMGENLARMEIFLFFTSLLQRFKFRSVDKSRLPGINDCNLGATNSPDPYTVVCEPVE